VTIAEGKGGFGGQMSLEQRIASVRKRLSESSGTAAGEPRTAARKAAGSGPEREAHGRGSSPLSARPRPRTIATDARRASGAIGGAGAEVLKLGREMLVIPAQLWLAAAELAGLGVLFAWRRALRPLLVAVLALIRAAYRLALRHVTPVRAVAAVCLVALASLAASQWLDYRGISVGTDAYSGGVGAVAPAPEVARQPAGDAHSWVMLPLALAGLAVLARALTGRPQAARLLIAVGIAAIAIAVAVDAPQGLDEGEAAITYQGAEARLLEGFWLQIAAGAVLIATGLLLPRFLLPASAASRAAAPDGSGPGPARRLLARAQGTLEHGPLTEPAADAERRVRGKRGVSRASP
jgi:hypothetical protein